MVKAHTEYSKQHTPYFKLFFVKVIYGTMEYYGVTV